MPRSTLSRLALSFVLLAACARAVAGAPPEHALQPETALNAWLLSSALPAPPDAPPAGDAGSELVATRPSAFSAAGKNGGSTERMKPFGDEFNAVVLSDKRAYVLTCVVNAPAATDAALLLAANADARVFVNGRRVPEPAAVPPSGGPRRVPYGIYRVPLRAGANRLQIAVSDVTQVTARLTTPSASAATAPSTGVPALGAGRHIGYRYDGSGRFPGDAPPRFWDETSAENIRWRTPLPSWSQGGVIVVGDRVFTQAEPNLLLCLDARTGRILWQREVDQLAAPNFSDADRERGRKLWRERFARHQEFVAACAEYQWLAGTPAKDTYGYVRTALRMAIREKSSRWDGPFDDTPATRARLRELEALWRERKWGGEGSAPFQEAKGTHFNHDLLVFPNDSEEARDHYGAFLDIEREFGFRLTANRGMQQRGTTGATPCSDGEFVYVSMGWGQVACYDFNGGLRWVRWFRASKNFSRRDGNTAMTEQGQTRVPPRLHGDRLIVVNGYVIRVLDKRTGEPAWEYPLPATSPGRHETGQPIVMELGGTTVLVCPQGPVLRLADGKPLLAQRADAWSPERSYAPENYQRSNNDQFVMGTPAVSGETLFMTHVMGVAAWTLAPAGGDAVSARSPWVWNLPFSRYAFGPWSTQILPSGHAESTSRTSPLYDPATGLLHVQCHGGEFYTFDAKTGKTVREWTMPGGADDRGDEGQSPALAGDLIFTHRNTLRTYVWAGGPDVRPVGTGLLVSEWTRDILERRLTWAEYKAKWFDRGYALLWQTTRNWCEPFIADGRLYLRTDEALYCIGRAE